MRNKTPMHIDTPLILLSMHFSAAFGWKYSRQEVGTRMASWDDLWYDYLYSVDSRAVMLVYYVNCSCIERFVMHNHVSLLPKGIIYQAGEAVLVQLNDASESCDVSNARPTPPTAIAKSHIKQNAQIHTHQPSTPPSSAALSTAAAAPAAPQTPPD